MTVVHAEANREYSDETSRMIAQDIRKFLADSHARVQETLMAKRIVLDALAALLSEREVVDRTALAGNHWRRACRGVSRRG